MKKQFKNRCIYRRLLPVVVCLLLFCLFPSRVFAAETTNAAKNAAKTVRVGYFPVDGFQEYDEETGVYSGYSYEFLMALSAYTGWKYEFVRFPSFAEAMTELQSGNIDLMNDVGKVEGRQVEYSSLNAGDGCSYLLMRDEEKQVAYNDWEGIAGLTIGLDKESAFNEQLFAILEAHDSHPKRVWYDNEQKMLAAWQAGEVDACVAMSDTAIDGHAVVIFTPRMYYLATTKGNTELIAEADLGIQALRANNPGFEAALHDKYYNRVSLNYAALTREEQQYIRENPVVRVLYIPDWYPISYQDEKGEFAGPFRQVYELLQQRTGLQFEFVPMDYDTPFESIVDTYGCTMLAEHPADYTGAAAYDVKLTQTFVNAGLVEVTGGTLHKGDTIALVDGDCLTEVVQRIFSDDFEYKMLDSVDDCVAQVQNGTVDGTVLMSYEAEYYQAQRQYRKLLYTVVNNSSYGFALAVSNEADPLLYSVIGKGLNSITTAEVNNIFNQMTQELRKPDLIDTVLDNPLQFGIGTAVAVAIVVLVISALFFTRKIKEKNDELIRANASTTRFFARMSHDMRTPMNGILGIAELSKSDNDVETLHGEMDKILQSGRYLLSLINDTLDFQRIESGNLKLDKEIVNYRAVMQNIVELVAPSARGKSIKFEVDDKQPVPDCAIWADPVRLKQIFINLLSNAIKFTPAGGTVAVEYECRQQTDTLLCDRFYIRDSGVGMSQEFIDTKLFKPFSQEHNEVTGQYAGSGLGLSIVKSLVDLMGGSITVESELGSGTTFIVDLDFARASESELQQRKAQQSKTASDTVHSLQGVTVLLAEDHPLNAEIAVRLLQKVGCAVDCAKDGQEAVERYSASAEGHYDAILMDIRMPVMDGLAATKAIRALPRADAAKIPIIAMTANAYDSDVKECLAAGMDAHIAKPIDPQRLYAVVEQYTAAPPQSKSGN